MNVKQDESFLVNAETHVGFVNKVFEFTVRRNQVEALSNKVIEDVNQVDSKPPTYHHNESPSTCLNLPALNTSHITVGKGILVTNTPGIAFYRFHMIQ